MNDHASSIFYMIPYFWRYVKLSQIYDVIQPDVALHLQVH